MYNPTSNPRGQARAGQGAGVPAAAARHGRALAGLRHALPAQVAVAHRRRAARAAPAAAAHQRRRHREHTVLYTHRHDTTGCRFDSCSNKRNFYIYIFFNNVSRIPSV